MKLKLNKDKKVLIGLGAGVLGLIVIVALIIIVVNSVKFKNPTGKDGGTASFNDITSSDTSTPSNSEGGSSSSNSGTDSKNEQGTSSTSSGEKLIEEGKITLPDKTVSAGDTVQVPIEIKKNPGIWGGQLFFNYDASSLEYVDYNKGDVFGNYDVVTVNNQVRCIIYSSETKDTSKNGTLITLVFKVKDNAKAGEYKISLDSESMLTNLAEQTVLPEIDTGKITVK